MTEKTPTLGANLQGRIGGTASLGPVPTKAPAKTPAGETKRTED